MNWGADDPELAETIRRLHDAPVPADHAMMSEIREMLDLPPKNREGSIARGFLAMLAIAVILLTAIAVALFVLGFLAHAAVAGWNAL